MTPEHLQKIEDAAAAAIGGPERRCQVAMADIYKAAGVLPADLEIPLGDRDWAGVQGVSIIAPYLDASPYFETVEGERQPGDLLGFRLGRVLHHVAILLSGGRMAHVFGAHGVQIAPCIPGEWAKRLERTWRIKTA